MAKTTNPSADKETKPEEKFIQIARCLALATDILGNLPQAREWMMTPNSRLGGLRPIDLCLKGRGSEVREKLLKKKNKLATSKKPLSPS